MPYPSKQVHIGKAKFNIYEDVYEPAEDTFLFAENLKINVGMMVLDLGTGCGVLGILAALQGASVIAVDINPHAVCCAKENSLLNGVKVKMGFVRASFFSAFNPKTCFDLVLFNAPYLPSEEGEESSWIGRSWAGGASGREVVDRFIANVSEHLKSDGRVLLMQSTLTGVEETIRRFSQYRLSAKVVAERKLPFFETLTLIEAVVDSQKETI